MRFIFAIFRFFVYRRYKITFKGFESVDKSKKKIFFPNHQGQIDSQLITSLFVKERIRMVPVIAERFFNNGLLKWIFGQFNGIRAADNIRGGRNINALDHLTSDVLKALDSGGNILLYPSGRHAGQGYEKIMNKKGAWHITNQLPDDVQILAVRVSGLWGSMWSNAWDGGSSGLFQTYFKGMFIIFANFIFLTPRRDVTIEFIDISEEARDKAKEGLQNFNNYLESIYNANGEEKPRFIKHFFFMPASKRQLPDVIENSYEEWKKSRTIDPEEIPEQIRMDIISIVKRIGEIDNEKITINSNLYTELGVDSISLIHILSAIEEKYELKTEIEVAMVKTIGDLCMIAAGKLHELEEELKPCDLKDIKHEVHIYSTDDTLTIPEAFIKVAKQKGKESFVYDKLLGATSYDSMLLKAYVVARILKKEIPGEKVGIMLPALQSTTLLIMATYMAGKIPVMFNWTVGEKVLNHCISISGVKQIVTATKFYEKVEDKLSKEAKDICIFLDQKVQAAGLGLKLGGVLDKITGKKPKQKPDDMAVILFTSGSEAQPKAVPLTHRNLMTMLSASLDHLKVNSEYILLGFLPPFHSFGFSILSVMPCICGIKTAYSPDPTDTKELVKIMKHTSANTILATPTFLRLILSISKKEDFNHVKLAVTGAESLQPSTIEDFYAKSSKGAVILEGYGITECSPVLSLNPLNYQKQKSVGTFIRGVNHLIVNIETWKPVDQGNEGMILVSGPNVFNGYLNKELDSPFIDIDGKTYYKTGDLGYIDDDGFLYITGRLKRFIKVAGEMFSLQSIENALIAKYGSSDELVLAVDGNDNDGNPIVRLFSIFKIDIKEANAHLLASGISGLIKISENIVIPEIPILGTGKTDYKLLKEYELMEV